MKARMVWLALVAVAAIAVGYVAARMWICGATGSDVERLQDVSHLARVLDLRPDQVTAIGALQKNLCGSLAACCARHCACRKELASVLVADPFDSARAREIRESLCRAYADSEMATLEHIRNIRALLDDWQRAKFDRMITESLSRACGACPGGGCECETRSAGAKH